MPRIWSEQDLKEFVSGRGCSLFDHLGESIEMPAWMADVADHIATTSAGERLGDTFEEDRGPLIAMAFGTYDDPGETQTGVIRIKIDGEWHLETLDLVYLGPGQPVVGSLMAMVREPIVMSEEGGDIGSPPSEQESVAWALATLDRTGIVQHVEGKVAAIFGRVPEDVVGHPLLEFVQPGAAKDSVRMWLELLTEPGATRTTRQRYAHPDGADPWIESSYLSRIEANDSGDVLALMYDITERRAQEQALRASQEEFRLLAAEVPTAVFRADSTGRILFHNSRLGLLMGDNVAPGHLRDIAVAEDRRLIDAALGELMTTTEFDSRRIQFQGVTGDRVLSMAVRSVIESESTVHSFVGSVSDVTGEVALTRRANHDELTGLLNRGAFAEELGDALIEHTPCVVAFIDLDGFKQVNDTYGHEAGDTVLREFSGRLRQALRPGDVVARHGGDEFVVMCGTDDPGAEVSIRARLSRTMLAPISWDGGAWQPSGSIGLARPEPDESAADVIRRADQAMFVVKNERNLRLA